MISWQLFEWTLPCPVNVQPSIAPVVLRVGEKEDEAVIARVVKAAFALDASWGDMNNVLQEKMTGVVEVAFASTTTACLVLAHGARVIGVSVVDTDEAALEHLLTGPCILCEYGNRGLASHLLAASLGLLAEKEVPMARGVARVGSVAARFVYPKFGGRAVGTREDSI